MHPWKGKLTGTFCFELRNELNWMSVISAEDFQQGYACSFLVAYISKWAEE